MKRAAGTACWLTLRGVCDEGLAPARDEVSDACANGEESFEAGPVVPVLQEPNVNIKEAAFGQQIVEFGFGKFAVVTERVKRMAFVEQGLRMDIMFAIIPSDIFAPNYAHSIAERSDVGDVNFKAAARTQDSLHFCQRRKRRMR